MKYIIFIAIIIHSALCGMEKKQPRFSHIEKSTKLLPDQGDTRNTDTHSIEIKTNNFKKISDKYKATIYTHIDQQQQYAIYNLIFNTITCITLLTGLSFTIAAKYPNPIAMFFLGGVAATASSMYVRYRQMRTLENMKSHISTYTSNLQSDAQATMHILETKSTELINSTMLEQIELLLEENKKLRAQLKQNK